MKILSTILILLIQGYSVLNGQTIKGQTWIYTNVFQNIDIMHPKINLGLEQKLKINDILGFELSFYYNNWEYNEPTKGFSIDLNYKHLIKNSLYYGVGLKGGFINYSTTGEFITGDIMDTTSVKYAEDYKIKKSIVEMNIKFGKKFENDFLMFDLFVGAGVRFKNVSHFDRNYPEHDFYRRHLRAINIRDTKGNYFLPTIKAGVLIELKIK
jgi:hypothetical protein